jgi:hypothetical protein
MPRRLTLPILIGPAAIVLQVALIGTAAAQAVWSGLTFEFNRPSGATPAPRDMITPSVHLTRGTTQGIYNAAPGKDFFYHDAAPSGTRWATSINNAGKLIEATNHANLTFATWLNAYGGFGIGNVIEGEKAVVHLVDENIYMDLQFTDWVDGRTEGGGGGFTYLRAEPPEMPMTNGDYNNNGEVDAADYVLWRATLGQNVAMPGIGADGNANGMIDDGDYAFWRAHFGEIVAGGQAASVLAAVPEPTCSVLVLTCLIAYQLGAVRGRRRS